MFMTASLNEDVNAYNKILNQTLSCLPPSSAPPPGRGRLDGAATALHTTVGAGHVRRPARRGMPGGVSGPNLRGRQDTRTEGQRMGGGAWEGGAGL